MFPRVIERPSNLIALNKSVTHHIENTNRKLLVRRSCSSPNLYLEHFIVRQNDFVPCPQGLKLFDIAKRDDWIPSLGKKKKRSLKDKEPEIFDAVIVRSRQVIEREDGSIDDVSGSTRIELISTSMTQIPWSSVWRTARNYYSLYFLLRESASLIRVYVVNFTNPCDMRAKCQVAVMINNIFRGRFW